MTNQNPYVGRIKNTGVHVVKGPHVDKGKKGTTKATTGGDLRTGKK